MSRMKSKIIGLDDEYSVEVIKGISDPKGNAFEGTLLHYDDIVDEVVHDVKYRTIEETVAAFMNKVLPDYIRRYKHSSIRGIVTDTDMYNFTKQYLLKTKICYGETLDVLQILPKEGYPMPNSKNKGFTIQEYNDYLLIAQKFSLELTRHLKYFGFHPDRNNSNTVDHTPGLKHDRIMNLVYTRYPWTDGYKMDKLTKSLIRAMKKDHLAGQDMSALGEKYPEVLSTLMKLSASMEIDGIKMEKVLRGNFDKSFKKFNTTTEKYRRKMVVEFSKLSPVDYGVYPE